MAMLGLAACGDGVAGPGDVGDAGVDGGIEWRCVYSRHGNPCDGDCCIVNKDTGAVYVVIFLPCHEVPECVGR